MPEKIQNITERTTAKGKPYFYVEFESGIEASAFNNQEVEYIRENLQSGDMCKAGIVQKGNYKNIVSIEKEIDDNEGVPKADTPKPPLKPQWKEGGSNIDWSTSLSYSKDVYCSMIQAGLIKDIRADDILTMTEVFYKSYPSRNQGKPMKHGIECPNCEGYNIIDIESIDGYQETTCVSCDSLLSFSWIIPIQETIEVKRKSRYTRNDKG